MRFLRSAVSMFRTRRKWRLYELNDWIIAPLGAGAALYAGYWFMVIAKVLPELISATQTHGLSWSVVCAFLFMGAQGVAVWLYGNLAKRCNEILYKRHFD